MKNNLLNRCVNDPTQLRHRSGSPRAWLSLGIGLAAGFAFLFGLFSGQAKALEVDSRGDELPRRSLLGAGFASDGTDISLSAVMPDLPAKKAGLAVGDVVIKLGGSPVTSLSQVTEFFRTTPGGTKVTCIVKRDGKEQEIVIDLGTQPTEVLDGHEVTYDSVQVPAGYRLRTIITTPTNQEPGARMPALFYIQGLPCASLDRPTALQAVDTKLIHAIAKAGFITMRVDKPGLGDSQGPPCAEIDFDTELAGYIAAAEQLKSLPQVDPERIYIFGHSMGGVMAPYVSQRVGGSAGGGDGGIRGIAVYGTTPRTWFEYVLENTRRQMRLAGAREADCTTMVQRQSKFMAPILLEKKTVSEVWDAYPELKDEESGITARTMYGRDISFYHQLQDLNIGEAWGGVSSAVLAIYGEYDWVASKEDHELIASIVNMGNSVQTPTGLLARVDVRPKADHGFTIHRSLKGSFGKMGQGTWDESLPETILNWIKEVENLGLGLKKDGEAQGGKEAGNDNQGAEGEAEVKPADEKEDAPRAASTKTLTQGEQASIEQASAKSHPNNAAVWKLLETERYPGKQDDVFFITPQTGWYVNGAGKIFKTTDAGSTWKTVLHKPGTYFRCIAFVDEKLGFAGNIGPGYFPNVTDTNPLYKTVDGGETWQEVTTIEGEPVVGLCALEVVKEPFVNAGNLDSRIRIVGVGRVGGPTTFIYSDDLGKTWKQRALSYGSSEKAAMAFDVHFFDFNNGIVAAGSSANVQDSNAIILATSDGGQTWEKRYQSTRPFEITWKIAFPSKQTGYVTIQSYNPDPTASQRFVAKTVDGGKTWSEIPLTDNHAVRQFGVAFVDDTYGWVGAMPHGFETRDGGATWTRATFGNAVNKIRVLSLPDSVHAYAIGTQVHSLNVTAKYGN